MARRSLSPGEVVLLAGVTGQLGGEFARQVLDAGGKLAAAVRRDWQVGKVREALGGGDDLLVGVVGPRDGEAAAGFVKGATDALGPITAFVSTAGLFREAEVGREPDGELQQLFEANLVSGAKLVRAVLPGMRRRDRGTITFVGSAGVGGEAPLSPNYLASKAAVHEYVRSLSVSLRGTAVRSSAIVPGTLDTDQRRARALEVLWAAAFGPVPDGGPLYPVAGTD